MHVCTLGDMTSMCPEGRRLADLTLALALLFRALQLALALLLAPLRIRLGLHPAHSHL